MKRLIELSSLANEVEPSPTLTMATRAKALIAKGVDIINLTVGEPDCPSPEYARNALIESLNHPNVSLVDKYTATVGVNPLRKAIAKKYEHLEYTEENIIVTVGAKEALLLSLLSIVSQNQVVAIAAPFWNTYLQMIRIARGKPLIIETGKETRLTYDHLVQAVKGKKVRALIINSPSNPTGRVIDDLELKRIVKFCLEKNIVIISDEVYEPFTYDGRKHSSAAMFGKDQTLICSAFSKMYAMTGWRIGWLAAHKEIISAASRLKDNMTSNVTVASQVVALAALSKGMEFPNQMSAEFEKRRNFVVAALQKMKIECPTPEGAFFVFPSIKKFKLSSDEFTQKLLDDAKVAIVSGSAFYAEGHIRISYATSLDMLKEGMNRIEKFVKTL